MISVIVPVYNAAKTLPACLQAIESSLGIDYECLVVDDGSTDNSPEVASQYSVKLIRAGGQPKGPAFARNIGAREATGDILFFVDSDVLIRPDTLATLSATFDQYPEYAAVFGSYDELPQDSGLISQYKNLTHHHFHQEGNPEAGTFWSGCGAIRADIFRDIGGFDEERYPQPSIEDIELGRRLINAGQKIYLDKGLQVKHLKRWTLLGLIKTDVKFRAIPWTRLILQENRVTSDLNLNPAQRTSAIFSLILVGSFLIGGIHTGGLSVILLLALPFVIFSAWHWNDGKIFYQVSAVGYGISLALLAFYWLFSPAFEDIIQAIPIFVAAGVLSVGKLLTGLGNMRQNALFFVLILSVVTLFITQIILMNAWVAIVIVFCVGAILWLNRGLFSFFVRSRGVLISTAFFPIQIMYYLYSLIAFGIGVVTHFFTATLKVDQKQS